MAGVTVARGVSAADPFTNGTYVNPTFTGVAQFADGAANAPSISRSVSATGFFFLNSTTIGVSHNGVQTGQFGSSFWLAPTTLDIGSTDTSMARISTGSLGMNARFSYKQGAAVASASQLTLGTDGNYFQITGTTGITLLDNTGWQGGSVITLKFNGALTVSHNTAASGNFKPIILNGATGFTTAASNTLTLRYDSTDAAWYEMSRKV